MTISKNKLAFSFFLLASALTATGQTVSPVDDYIRLADDFKKNSKPDSAIFYYEKASAVFQEQGDIEKLINSYNQLGVVLTRKDEYEKATSYLEKALEAGLSLSDSNNLLIATTYLNLGVIYNAQENYKQSLVYHHKALAIRTQKLGDYHSDVATSYGNIGNVFFKQ